MGMKEAHSLLIALTQKWHVVWQFSSQNKPYGPNLLGSLGMKRKEHMGYLMGTILTSLSPCPCGPLLPL
jgi:hypothetical protein